MARCRICGFVESQGLMHPTCDGCGILAGPGHFASKRVKRVCDIRRSGKKKPVRISLLLCLDCAYQVKTRALNNPYVNYVERVRARRGF